MPFKNTSKHYGMGTKIIHWLITLFIFSQLAFVWIRDMLADGPLRSELIFYHKSFGLVLLALTIIFILWKLINRKPNYPTKLKAWEKMAAHSVQGLMLLLLLIMTLSGWFFVTAAGKPVNFFGLGLIPMPGVPLDKSLAHTAKEFHQAIALALVGLIAIHIVAALKHHFIDKDKVLANML